MTHTFAPFNDLLTEASAAFSQANPSVKIEYSHVPHPEYDPKLLSLFSADDAPTMFWSYYPNMLRLVELNALAPVPDAVLQDLKANVDATTIERTQYKGASWGYPNPFLILPLVNEASLVDSGATEPTSYEEMRQFQQQATVQSGGQYERFGVTLEAGRDPIWVSIHFSPLLWGAGADWLTEDGTATAFNTDAVVEQLELYKELAPLDAQPFQETFAGGKAVMTASGWYQRYFLSSSAPGLQLGVRDAPKGADGSSIATAYYWSWVVNGRVSAEEQDAAWQFIQFITSAEWNKRFDEIGHGVARTDSLAEYQNDPWMKTFLDNLQYGRLFGRTPAWPELEITFARTMSRFTGGEIEAKDALTEAEAELNAILANFRA